uniref:Uncharacterized protein n=1 Tax=Oryza punctata TaxID=4537 RepID=A0A0E0MK20_ORYPU
MMSISERGLVVLPELKGWSEQSTHIRRTPSRSSYRCSGGRSYGLCSLNMSSVSSTAAKPAVGSTSAPELPSHGSKGKRMSHGSEFRGQYHPAGQHLASKKTNHAYGSNSSNSRHGKC